MSDQRNPSSTHRPQAESEVIARFREIAEQSTGLADIDGSVPASPDWQLLDACAEALHLMRQADELMEAQRGVKYDNQRDYDNFLRELHRADAEAMTLRQKAKRGLRKAGRVPAQTAAGIYAKALCVRASTTGTAVLARSLAEDLVNLPQLRAMLWPPCPVGVP